jgi:hypothetical protein
MLSLAYTIVFGATLLMSSVAGASTVYRWIDERGRVHYSDVVPDRYKRIAKPVNAGGAEPTAEQQREALERTKALLASTNRSASASSAAPASVASAPSAKRPAQVPNDRTDCVTWQRLYEESAECFGPYRTVGGGIRPGAFEVCNEVPEPPPTRCRMSIPSTTTP